MCKGKEGEKVGSVEQEKHCLERTRKRRVEVYERENEEKSIRWDAESNWV